MLVVLQHLRLAEHKYLAGHEVLAPVFAFAASGVDRFFVISGFVITTTSWHSFGQAKVVPDFLFRRAARIYPLYWCYASLAVAVAIAMPRWVHDTYEWRDIVASYVLWPTAKGPVLSVALTLTYEVWFYAVMAVAIALVPRGHFVRWLAGWALIVFIAQAALWRVPLPPLVLVVTHPLALEFIAGALVACFWRCVPVRWRCACWCWARCSASWRWSR